MTSSLDVSENRNCNMIGYYYMYTADRQMLSSGSRRTFSYNFGPFQIFCMNCFVFSSFFCSFFVLAVCSKQSGSVSFFKVC